MHETRRQQLLAKKIKRFFVAWLRKTVALLKSHRSIAYRYWRVSFEQCKNIGSTLSSALLSSINLVTSRSFRRAAALPSVVNDTMFSSMHSS